MRTAVAVGTVVATVGLTSAVAHAATNTAAGTTAKAAPRAAAAGRNYTYLEFDKGASPTNSRLRFVYVQNTNPDHVRSWVVASWRAGSGDGSKNTCYRNHGWLPNGTYKILHYYAHHNGGAHGVNGISWQISDHKCWNGTPRTELFVHSKMLPSGKQGSGPYRWTGSYVSNGCVKLSPTDIRSLQSLWNSSYPRPTQLYVR
ncbi:MAG TPA: hypothetical protein VGL02_12625 [Streptomyces sp.]